MKVNHSEEEIKNIVTVVNMAKGKLTEDAQDRVDLLLETLEYGLRSLQGYNTMPAKLKTPSTSWRKPKASHLRTQTRVLEMYEQSCATLINPTVEALKGMFHSV